MVVVATQVVVLDVLVTAGALEENSLDVDLECDAVLAPIVPPYPGMNDEEIVVPAATTLAARELRAGLPPSYPQKETLSKTLVR